MFNLEQAIADWKKDMRRSRAVQDGDLAELESYLRDKVEDLIGRGMSGEEAFKAAEAEFDRADDLDADYYRARSPKGGGRPPWQAPRFVPALVWSYAKIALRKIRRQKGYAVINIAGLSLGLVAALFVVLYIRFETSYDRHFAAADRIFRLVSAENTGSPFILGDKVRLQVPEVEALTAVRQLEGAGGGGFLITAGSKQLRGEKLFVADPFFFRVFSAAFLAGRAETALADSQAAVLSESAAKRMFGTVDCLGGVFEVKGEGRADLRVAAVVRDLPANTHFSFDVLAPVAAAPVLLNWDDRTSWGSWNYVTYFLLQPGTAAAAVLPKIISCFPESVRREPIGADNVRLQALTDIHLRSHLRNEFQPNNDVRTILLLSAVGLLIFLSASFNFINLSTANSLRRNREVGMRKVMGAGRRAIVRQFLGESLVVTALASSAALALFHLGLPALAWLAGTGLRPGDTDWREVLLILAGLTLFLGLAAGAYPAFFAAAFQPARTLKGENVMSPKRFPVRNVLLVCQFLISLGLVTAAFIVQAQMHYLKTKDLGLDKDQIVNIRLPKELRSRADGLKAELLGGPGIEAAAASDFVPSQATQYQVFAWEGKRSEDDGMLRWIAVDADFLDAFGLTVVDGRGPLPEDQSSGEQKFLVNEAAVRRLGIAKTVGTRIEIQANFGKPGRIIGVVKDFHFRSLHYPLEPLAFFVAPPKIQVATRNRTYDYTPFEILSVKLAGARIPEGLKEIRAFCAKHIPEDPSAWSFFDDEFGRMYAGEIRTSGLFEGLSIFATLIAGLGVFGLSAFTIERRRKEVGIRKVLGAGPARVLLLFSADFLKLLVVAAVLAAPLVHLAMESWLRKFAYRIALGPWFIAGGLGFLTILLVATVAWQGLRTALANPAVQIRNE